MKSNFFSLTCHLISPQEKLTETLQIHNEKCSSSFLYSEELGTPCTFFIIIKFKVCSCNLQCKITNIIDIILKPCTATIQRRNLAIFSYYIECISFEPSCINVNKLL